MKLVPEDGLQKLVDSGELFVELFRHGTLSIEVYMPPKKDLQKPHDRDEIYIISPATEISFPEMKYTDSGQVTSFLFPQVSHTTLKIFQRILQLGLFSMAPREASKYSR